MPEPPNSSNKPRERALTMGGHHRDDTHEPLSLVGLTAEKRAAAVAKTAPKAVLDKKTEGNGRAIVSEDDILEFITAPSKYEPFIKDLFAQKLDTKTTGERAKSEIMSRTGAIIRDHGISWQDPDAPKNVHDIIMNECAQFERAVDAVWQATPRAGAQDEKQRIQEQEQKGLKCLSISQEAAAELTENEMHARARALLNEFKLDAKDPMAAMVETLCLERESARTIKILKRCHAEEMPSHMMAQRDSERFRLQKRTEKSILACFESAGKFRREKLDEAVKRLTPLEYLERTGYRHPAIGVVPRPSERAVAGGGTANPAGTEKTTFDKEVDEIRQLIAGWRAQPLVTVIVRDAEGNAKVLKNASGNPTGVEKKQITLTEAVDQALQKYTTRPDGTANKRAGNFLFALAGAPTTAEAKKIVVTEMLSRTVGIAKEKGLDLNNKEFQGPVQSSHATLIFHGLMEQAMGELETVLGYIDPANIYGKACREALDEARRCVPDTSVPVETGGVSPLKIIETLEQQGRVSHIDHAKGVSEEEIRQGKLLLEHLWARTVTNGRDTFFKAESKAEFVRDFRAYADLINTRVAKGQQLKAVILDFVGRYEKSAGEQSPVSFFLCSADPLLLSKRDLLGRAIQEVRDGFHEASLGVARDGGSYTQQVQAVMRSDLQAKTGEIGNAAMKELAAFIDNLPHEVNVISSRPENNQLTEKRIIKALRDFGSAHNIEAFQIEKGVSQKLAQQTKQREKEESTKETQQQAREQQAVHTDMRERQAAKTVAQLNAEAFLNNMARLHEERKRKVAEGKAPEHELKAWEETMSWLRTLSSQELSDYRTYMNNNKSDFADRASMKALREALRTGTRTLNEREPKRGGLIIFVDTLIGLGIKFLAG